MSAGYVCQAILKFGTEQSSAADDIARQAKKNMGHTPDGKLASRTWARGIVTEYTYDTLGQLTNISYGQSLMDSPITYTYNRVGQQTIITDALGARTNIYNALGQLVAEKLPDGTTLTRTHDTLGRPSGMALDSDYALTYGYDSYGRFSAISSSVSSVQSVVDYSYLPGADLLSGYTATQVSGLTFQDSRIYKPHRDLITSIQNTFGTNLVSSFAYTNDEIGRRTARVDSAAVTNTFGYNHRSEIISAFMGAKDHAYAYDPIGNRLTAILNTHTNTYAANELNQYVEISNGGMIEPVFDNDGNMIEYGDWTFIWDGENRLIEFASNSVTVVENQYDYMSRRIMKTTATETNSYLYDSWNMIREIKTPNNQSSITNNFVWGVDLSGTLQGAGGVGGLLMTVLDGDPYFPAQDASGNITGYTDTNGTIVAQYEYDPFGNVSAQSGALADDFVYRFSTKFTDDETGLVYYGYRFYKHDLGRWLSRDPLGEMAYLQNYRSIQIYRAVERLRDAEKRLLHQLMESQEYALPLPEDMDTSIRRLLSNHNQAYQVNSGDGLYLFVSNDPIGNEDVLELGIIDFPSDGSYSPPDLGVCLTGWYSIYSGPFRVLPMGNGYNWYYRTVIMKCDCPEQTVRQKWGLITSGGVPG
ncbi:MAG: RHS repeat protein [Verrucomicrobiae bacterium]|nr:RHS repeat protein [Verrucomicrobiae bacterium]